MIGQWLTLMQQLCTLIDQWCTVSTPGPLSWECGSFLYDIMEHYARIVGQFDGIVVHCDGTVGHFDGNVFDSGTLSIDM